MASPSNNSPILITGGTGKTGSRIAKRYDRQRLSVRIGSRVRRAGIRLVRSWDVGRGRSRESRPSMSRSSRTLTAPGALRSFEAFFAQALAAGARRSCCSPDRGEEEAAGGREALMATGSIGRSCARAGSIRTSPRASSMDPHRHAGVAGCPDPGTVHRRRRHRGNRFRGAHPAGPSANCTNDRPTRDDVRRSRRRDPGVDGRRLSSDRSAPRSSSADAPPILDAGELRRADDLSFHRPARWPQREAGRRRRTSAWPSAPRLLGLSNSGDQLRSGRRTCWSVTRDARPFSPLSGVASLAESSSRSPLSSWRRSAACRRARRRGDKSHQRHGAQSAVPHAFMGTLLSAPCSRP